MRRIFCLLVIVLLQFNIYAQITSSGKPVYQPLRDTFFVPVIDIKVPELVTEKKSEGFHLKDNQFAVPIETDISPENYGIWKDYPGLNKKIWLLSIHAEDAVSMNIILNPFKLIPGAKLFFYNKTQTQVIGAITYRNNKESGVLPLAQINTDKVFIELQIPLFTDEYGAFKVSDIGIEKRSGEETLKGPMDEWFNKSQACNVNVNCFNASNIREQKNSVVRIIYRGSQRCTGTLINNLEFDGTPYVLTAGHCFTQEYLANTAVFYFNYESPACENVDGPIHTVSGANIIAAGFHGTEKDTLDFVLLKLTKSPPLEYRAIYSGWDATGIPPDSTYVIHHPQGDIKKISVDTNTPQTGSAGLGFDDYTHWIIKTYELGTTEAGSSGSGLIDQNNRLIGTLTGGLDPCSYIINDLYQKFSHSYADYQDPGYQLKNWLDPQGTGLLKCNSYDITGVFRESAETISNYDSSDIKQEIKQQEDWGYLSGHNYQENFVFAEHFSIKGSKYIYGAYIDPAIAYASNFDQTVNFVLWEGGDTPGKILYEKNYLISEIDENDEFYIDFDSTILVSNEFFFGYQIAYTGDTFAVKTIPVEEELSNTAYTHIDGAWKPLQFDGISYPAHLAIDILVFDFMPKKGQNPYDEERQSVTIYPNPVFDQIQILFKEKAEGVVQVKIYDLSGRPVTTSQFIDPPVNLPFKVNLPLGVYIMQVIMNNNAIKSFKILIR